MTDKYLMKAVDTKALGVLNAIDGHLAAIAEIASEAAGDPDFEGLALVDHLSQLVQPTHMISGQEPRPYLFMAHPFDRLTIRATQLRAKLGA